MATQTPRRHPRKSQQTANRYPFRLTIKKTVRKADDEIIAVDLPCAYEPAQGGESGPLESEAMASDKIRVPSWEPTAKAKQLAVVDMKGAGIVRFNILDVLPIGEGPDAMMLMVSREN